MTSAYRPFVLAALAVSGCTGAGGDKITTPDPVTSVTVQPSNVTALVGATQQLTATTSGASGTALTGRRITWTSDNPGVAGVDSVGLLTVRAAGTAKVTASSEGKSANVAVMAEQIDEVTLTVGREHACALTPSGTAYCWGENGDGQLGDGTTTDRGTPVGVLGEHTFVAISAGGTHTLALTRSGAAYSWGSNLHGQLGDGTRTSRGTPAPVAGGQVFIAVSAGYRHSVALVLGGSAYAWGNNALGQLGDSTNLGPRTVPVRVSGGLSFRAISAGGQHTAALTRAGAAYTWGANQFNQLGNGTRYPEVGGSTSPAAVSGGLPFTSISAGFYHTVAIAGDGLAYGWGGNTNHQLGDGTNTNRNSPVPVSGGRVFQQISGGMYHTLAITPTGAAYGWGENLSGEVGDGTTLPRGVPVAVAGGLTFRRIGAGAAFSSAVASAGSAHAWGLNASGQLGDGTSTSRSTPGTVSGGLVFR